MSTFFDCSSRRLSRREFVARSSMALGSVAVLPTAHIFAESGKTEFIEVDTSYGRVRGRRGDGLATFKGIPYGGSASGANRFKAAAPLQPWTGVRDALKSGAPSLQAVHCDLLSASARACLRRTAFISTCGRRRPTGASVRSCSIATEAASPSAQAELRIRTPATWLVSGMWSLLRNESPPWLDGIPLPRRTWLAKSTPPPATRACSIYATG